MAVIRDGGARMTLPGALVRLSSHLHPSRGPPRFIHEK